MTRITFFATIVLLALSSVNAAPVLRRCQIVSNPGILNPRCIEYINAGITNLDSRDSVGIGNDDTNLSATFDGATLPSIIAANVYDKRQDGGGYSVGIGNGDYNTNLNLDGAIGDMTISGSRR
ncbi:hypothetical protein CBS101457_003887 [Exobasidium rhododendri]|nr:hypothetical protein CBS101457_003887 [Exobasidium rhododendri]